MAGRFGVTVLAVILAAAVAAAGTDGPIGHGGPGRRAAAPVPAAARGSLAAQDDLAAFSGSWRPLPRRLRRRMDGVTWHPGCPVPRRKLALVEVSFVDFRRQARRGRIVVHRSVADDVVGVFRRLYRKRFRIHRMRLPEAYDGDDRAMMRDDNSSGFNCRTVTGGSTWSRHAYGTAIDLNPVRNPYVKGSTVLPRKGRRFLDREDVRKGMVVRPGPVRRAFRDIGWAWGGDWRTLKDYMHFSADGR